MSGRILLGENLELLPQFPDASFQLIYIDPPFNTGRTQRRITLETVADIAGDREGFGGKRYRSQAPGTAAYADSFDDYPAFLAPRLAEAHRLLHPTGTLYVHLDYREAHYVKIQLDAIFGRDAFLNELIWAYDYGGKPKNRWPAKHDTILVYVRDPRRALLRCRRRGSRAVHGARGWSPPRRRPAASAVPTSSGTPSSPPPAARRRATPRKSPRDWSDGFVQASSAPGDTVLDFFAGSGTLGAVAEKLGRKLRPDRLESRSSGDHARPPARCTHSSSAAGSVTGAWQANRSQTYTAGFPSTSVFPSSSGSELGSPDPNA